MTPEILAALEQAKREQHPEVLATVIAIVGHFHLVPSNRECDFKSKIILLKSLFPVAV